MECAAPLTCGAHELCQPLAALGELCSGTPCADGARCVDDHCVALAQVGEPCREDSQCIGTARCVAEACIPIALPGEPCGPTNICAGAFWCDAGTCEPSPELGEPCTALSPCAHGDCTDGVCVGQDHGSCWAGPLELWCESSLCIELDGPPTCGRPDAVEGEPCGYVTEPTNLYTLCERSSYCDMPDGARAGTCRPLILPRCAP